MHTLRAKFKNQIIAEFLPPQRHNKKTKVVILLDGMPSVPNKKQLLEFFSKKGYWVFHPRYRGTWESEGRFLAKSPHLDVIDVIDEVYSGFLDLWNSDKIQLTPDQLILIGGSFGGPAVILASKDKRVDKAIAISSVIDWTKPGPAEPLETLAKFTKNAFGNGYRIAKSGWAKIASGKFYNPINEVKNLSGNKLLLFHANQDPVCRYSEAKKFAKTINSKLVTINSKDHWSSKNLILPKYFKILKKFLDK